MISKLILLAQVTLAWVVEKIKDKVQAFRINRAVRRAIKKGTVFTVYETTALKLTNDDIHVSRKDLDNLYLN